MNLRYSNQRIHALTLIELLVVILVLAILAALLLPALAVNKKRSSKINCVNNLKQVGLAFRIWSSDNFDKYPMEVSTSKGGATELLNTPDAWKTFQVMSNELSMPKILICPEDSNHVYATNFSTGFSIKNISYFIGLDASTNSPRALLVGDDNFAIDGEIVKSGLLTVESNTPIVWTTARHHSSGNVCLADGSVQQLSDSGLKNQLRQTGLATNRLVIP